MTNLIDKTELLTRIESAMSAFENIEPTLDRDGLMYLGGARSALAKLRDGIYYGVYDAAPEPDALQLYSEDIGEDTEDMDDEAPEEARVKYGVFYVKGDSRSIYVKGDSRSEAWAAVLDKEVQGGISSERYEVRPL